MNAQHTLRTESVVTESFVAESVVAETAFIAVLEGPPANDDHVPTLHPSPGVALCGPSRAASHRPDTTHARSTVRRRMSADDLAVSLLGAPVEALGTLLIDDARTEFDAQVQNFAEAQSFAQAHNDALEPSPALGSTASEFTASELRSLSNLNTHSSVLESSLGASLGNACVSALESALDFTAQPLVLDALDYCFGVHLPAPSQLGRHGQPKVHDVLYPAILALGKLNVFLAHTDHLCNDTLYAKLHHLLSVDALPLPNIGHHWVLDFVLGEQHLSLMTYLEFYAHDDERAAFEQLRGYVLPARRELAFDRDRFIPVPEGRRGWSIGAALIGPRVDKQSIPVGRPCTLPPPGHLLTRRTALHTRPTTALTQTPARPLGRPLG